MMLLILIAIAFFAEADSFLGAHHRSQLTRRFLSNADAASTSSDVTVPENDVDIRPKQFTLSCREEDDTCGVYLNITESGIAFFGPTSNSPVAIKWDGGPARVLVLAKPDEDIAPSVEKAILSLWGRGIDVIVEEDVYQSMKSGRFSNQVTKKSLTILDLNKKQGIDLVMTFGGDGLLMHCNAMFGARSIPPIMSFDFGSLGFLSPFEYENFECELERMIEEGCMVTLRMRLECSVHRKSPSGGGHEQHGETVHALNEVVIDRGPASFLSVLDISCDNRHMTTLQGDGIIIATPTGSTAYSLAAGGSMVHPAVPAILLTPICAHTLSFRPLLVPDSSVLECAVPEDCRASGWASFDGKSRQELERGDFLRVQLSIFPMPTVQRANFTTDWFDALRSGFMFNERPRQSSKIPLK